MGVVAGPEPFNERQNIAVSPHPSRESLKVRQRCIGILVIGRSHHVAVDAVGIGPVSFDGDCSESTLVNQAAGNPGPFPVKVVRAMRRFADQDETPVAYEVEQGVIVGVLTSDEMTMLVNRGSGLRRNRQRNIPPSTRPLVRLHAGVGTREKEGVVVAVCPAHHIPTIGTAHLDHLAVAVRITDVVTLDHDAITYLGLHVKSPFVHIRA